MKTLISLGLCLALLLVVSASAVASPVRPEVPDPGTQNEEDRFMTPRIESLPLGDSMAKAAEDTVTLYGGPGTTEGKFQQSNGVSPDWGGWFGVDETDIPAFWHVDTLNAENLNDNGPGNHAMWCGEDNPTWTSPGPGYGNNWNVSLTWSSGPLSNPGVAQEVGLDFFFNYETEACCDFFYVEYDSAGSWKSVLVGAGTNKEEDGTFPTPGVQYSATPATPISFAGDDYGGENGDEIQLRIRFVSDSGWSDADGLTPTDAGAMQVDDVSISWSEGSSFENFEGSAPYVWTPVKGPFVGNFCKLYARMDDIDPCRTNDSPLVTFVDDGTPPTNGGGVSTGGETSSNWFYGVPGGWVVNYNGGLSDDEYWLINAVWSPPIAWDLPGTEDDGVEWAGARERHDVWGHLPLDNGIFWSVEVRCSTDGGTSWLAWNRPDDGGLWYGAASWYPHDMDISEVLVPGLTHLQFRAVARDYADLYGFTGDDATPAPAFDNLAIKKYRLLGPVMAADGVYLAGDGFPVTGQIDVSTKAARDDLDIPFDRVSDITGLDDPRIDPGDSITVTVQTKIPGTTLADHRMVWIMDKNPLFDSVRVMPVGTTVIAGGAANGWDQWMGEVPGQQSTSAAGTPVEDLYFYDLPDEDFMYPADRIRYYIQAEDNDGRVTTFPRDISGFADGNGYNPLFAVKGLPSIVENSGTQPPILFVNDNGFRGFTDAYHAAFKENGYVEGVDYDVYNVTRPDNSWNSNGLGSAGAHGANADQLVNYEVILYETGRLSRHLISDGSGTGGNENDDTIEVLTAWRNQPHDRYMVFCGDDLVSGTVAQGSSTFVQQIMGVNSVDNDIRDYVDGQTTPQVTPLLPEFGYSYTAYGGCFGINTFDEIEPLGGAVRGHAFLKSEGQTYDSIAASVVFDLPDVNGFRKAVVTYPYSLFYMYSAVEKAPVGRSARASVLKETLDYFKLFVPSGNAVGVDEPPSKRIQDARFYPNPFNPTTTVEFRLDVAADVSVRIYNLRGERVRELIDGEITAGLQRLIWDGTDDSGSSVASGVYIVDVRGPANRETQKVALVK